MIVLLVALVGLFIGSFLNVVELRGLKNFITGRSHCPKCKTNLNWYELLPIISWIILRARCRTCKKPISAQYPLVELATGILFGLSYSLLSPMTVLEWFQLALWLVILCGLIILTIFDLKEYILPDKVLLPLLVPAFLLLITYYIATQSLAVIYIPIVAGLVFGGFFYLLAAVSRGTWMGGGDIKLAFVMGIVLGFQKTLLAMFIAFNAASIIGIALIITRHLRRGEALPFGPFLILGTVASFLYGHEVITWYLENTNLVYLFTG